MVKVIDKYLGGYAEPEILVLQDFPNQLCFETAIVIPAYKESNHFVQRLIVSPIADNNVLMVVVINQPESCDECHPQQLLFEQILASGDVAWQRGNLHWVTFANKKATVLVVDRFSVPLPDKQGVGLARKIGADIVSWLYANEQLNSRWFGSTDADATLPKDYCQQLQVLGNEQSAACFSFRHYCDNEEIHWANQQYELALRYYVAGLKFAGSPYAFFTIGSLLAINIEDYCAVRGFPKRCAGEDFYLLNKLAKLKPVGQLIGGKIVIAARTSDRVPFGTGPAVTNILSLKSQGKDYCYYHPQVFEELKQLLMAFSPLSDAPEQYPQWMSSLSVISQQSLTSIGFDQFINSHLAHDKKQFIKQLFIWFDAFKTLKFIHALRELGLENIPLNQALTKANFVMQYD